MVSLKCYVVYLCLCISCLLVQNIEAAPTFSFHDCENSTTFTANTSYGSNLQRLLSSLSSYDATNNSFYTSVGREVQNTVFGLIMCRGDIMNTLICQECVRNASSEIPRRCREKKRAIIWYDECVVRYSDKPIYGVLDETSSKFLPSSSSLKEENDGIELLWAGMINSLAEQAARLPEKFAVREESEGSYSQKLYGLVQCTLDLSASSCTSCFQKAIAATPVAYKGKQGGRVLLPSCFIRYEFFRFFNHTEASPPPILSPPPPGKNKISSVMIIAIVASIIASGLLFGMGYYFLHGRAIKKYNALIPENAKKDIASIESMQFSFKSIETATSKFSDCNKLGKGGFGEVYKGILINGKEIAVKRLSKSSGQGAEEFKNEVVLVAKLQHKNLVRLLGFCLEGEEKILVYEYVANKSLDYFLFDPKKRDQLDWSIRCNLVGGIARGILYLHEDSRLKVIHRDLKASNVLLDKSMIPKISDFGMAKMFGVDQIQGNTARIVGTYGYMAPEYAMQGLYSIKSDVFSFGVLLLEILSGRRNTGFHLVDYAPSLVQYAWQLWNENKVLELMDPLMNDSCPPNEFLRYVHIGLLCVQEDANKRPTMSTVVLMLKSESLNLAQPQRPAFFVGRFTENHEIGIEICSVNAITISDFLPR